MKGQNLGWLDSLSNAEATILGTALGAAAGLIAILLGAMYNAHLNRKRDERLRQQEAIALATALREELKLIHSALVVNAKRWREKQEPDSASVGSDIMHMVKVFPNAIPRLGLLTAEAIAATVYAYGQIDQHGETLMLMGAKPETLPSGRVMYMLPGSSAALAAKMNDHVAADIQKAIDLL